MKRLKRAGTPAERTKSGRLVDTSPANETVVDEEYWADRPSGFCGGQRLRSTLKEDIAVSSIGIQATLDMCKRMRCCASRCALECCLTCYCLSGLGASSYHMATSLPES